MEIKEYIATKSIQTDASARMALVAAAQTGDRAAFGELIEQFQGAVYAIAFRRLGDHADAQEVCQEVFIQAMRKIGQLRDPRCFAGWLRSMTQRMALNRAVRRGPAMPELRDGFEPASDPTPLTAALDAECRAQVRSGLDQLSALDRDTLVAFYFDGQSLVEMSDQFRTPVGTIKRRLHVARKRLAQQLASVLV
jgi:RNA polymerase sigma-70 factor (ECF subfamily)